MIVINNFNICTTEKCLFPSKNN